MRRVARPRRTGLRAVRLEGVSKAYLALHASPIPRAKTKAGAGGAEVRLATFLAADSIPPPVVDLLGFVRLLPLQFEYLGLFCCWVIGWLVLWLLVGIWVYRDAESRGMSGVLWLLVVLVAGIIGIIIYLVVRTDRPSGGYPSAPQPGYYPPTPVYRPPIAGPSSRTCRSCGGPLPIAASFCPTCGGKT